MLHNDSWRQLSAAVKFLYLYDILYYYTTFPSGMVLSKPYSFAITSKNVFQSSFIASFCKCLNVCYLLVAI